MIYQKKHLIRGVLWSGIDKIGVVVIQLLLELILARNLLPADYGIIGMATIFIALGAIFSESGFSNALIHNQERNEVDFATAFYFNLFVSILFVTVIFFIAPLAAKYFDTPVLTNVLRVASLSVVFSAATMVQKTKLSILMDFKTQSKVSLLSLICSGVVGVYMAMNGFGVWSLVTQIVLQSFLTFLLLAFFVKWMPGFVFSFQAFKKLFRYGSNLLWAGLLQNVYVNLYNLLIGKRYSASTLGLYSKSNQFTFMPSSLISGILQRVMFPYFASFQHDNDKIYAFNQQYTRMICLAILPLFLYLSIFAEPLVYYGLSIKWIEAVPIIKILSIAYIFQPIIVNNMILFQVKNKTNLFFFIEIITKITGIIILVLTIEHGIVAICLGILIQLCLQFLITGSTVYFLLKRNIFSQLLLIGPYLLYAGCCGLLLYYFQQYFLLFRINYLLVGSLLFMVLYAIFYFFFERKNILFIMNILKSKS